MRKICAWVSCRDGSRKFIRNGTKVGAFASAWVKDQGGLGLGRDDGGGKDGWKGSCIANRYPSSPTSRSSLVTRHSSTWRLNDFHHIHHVLDPVEIDPSRRANQVQCYRFCVYRSIACVMNRADRGDRKQRCLYAFF